ncbi:MAG: hypothetical protein WB390_02025, partial [Pseudolabrys sp.]
MAASAFEMQIEGVVGVHCPCFAVHSTWKRFSRNQISRIVQTSVSTTPHPISAAGHRSEILINCLSCFYIQEIDA